MDLICLNHRFTIPIFPSRLLNYMQAGLPVLCCTDPNTDIGKVCVEGGFGWWCESNDVGAFCALAERVYALESLTQFGKNGLAYLQENYNVKNACDIIIKSI